MAEDKETLNSVANQEKEQVNTGLEPWERFLWEERVSEAGQGVGGTHDGGGEEEVFGERRGVKDGIPPKFAEHEIPVAEIVENERDRTSEKDGEK